MRLREHTKSSIQWVAQIDTEFANKKNKKKMNACPSRAAQMVKADHSPYFIVEEI